MRKNTGLFLLTLIIAVLGLTAGVMTVNQVGTKIPAPSPTPINTPNVLSPTPFNVLQLKTFEISPSPTITQSQNPLDYTAPGVDWDDVYIYTLNNCQTLSQTCKQEALQAVYTELGTSDLSTGEPGLHPGSRAYLCYQDFSCRVSGYSAYRGSTPLPVYTPSASCITEYQTCAQNNIAHLHQTCPELFDTNCDKSDSICSGTGVGCN